MDNGFFVFFKHLFSLSNVHPSFSKLEIILTLMIMKAKGFGSNKIHLKTHLSFFFKHDFDLQFMNFVNIFLTKVIHFFVI
jgi:hypothetical protein